MGLRFAPIYLITTQFLQTKPIKGTLTFSKKVKFPNKLTIQSQWRLAFGHQWLLTVCCHFLSYCKLTAQQVGLMVLTLSLLLRFNGPNFKTVYVVHQPHSGVLPVFQSPIWNMHSDYMCTFLFHMQVETLEWSHSLVCSDSKCAALQKQNSVSCRVKTWVHC